MDLKEKLKIAYRLAEIYDYVTDDIVLEEANEELEQDITQEDLNLVLETFNGYGMNALDDVIRYEYFKN